MMAFVVAATWTARPGEADAVASAVGRLIEPSRNEPGNLVYEPHRSLEDPRVFFFYEQYVDRAAYEAHARSSHFTELASHGAIPRLESRHRAFYESWSR